MSKLCYRCDTQVLLAKIGVETVKIDPFPAEDGLGDWAVLAPRKGRAAFQPPVVYRITDTSPLLPGYRAHKDHQPECDRLRPRRKTGVPS